MFASTFRNKFYPFSLGLSLLSAIPFGIASLHALSLPQSAQAVSFAPDREQALNTQEELMTIQEQELLRRRQEEEEWRQRQQKEELLEPVSPIFPCINGAGFPCAPWQPERPGSSQQNPIMPTITQPGFWTFIDFISGDWGDPPTAYGFRYEMTSDSVFTEIIDFPTGFSKPFTVLVKDVILGEFTPGNSVSFSNYSQLLGNLLVGGSGVKEFSVTGLNVDPTNSTAFPLKLEFNTDKANFNMHALLNEAEAVPEPSAMLGLFASGSFLVGVVRKRKQKLSR
ncbi:MULTISPECIES: PEP-CTERM sorting domain-containing protein [unclassified Microcoleus]|uniref:PEP-CTERM sorting domain-containing protein n=1 Tax=unclassified Microcoleus TaxID=2642155 RepID=UPI002FD28834